MYFFKDGILKLSKFVSGELFQKIATDFANDPSSRPVDDGKYGPLFLFSIM